LPPSHRRRCIRPRGCAGWPKWGDQQRTALHSLAFNSEPK
jgi:hypothetical protein